MNFKEILGLNPILTGKIGNLLAKFAQIIWYIALVLGVIGLVALLGTLLSFNISAFIFGLASWIFYMALVRIACEALASLKQ